MVTNYICTHKFFSVDFVEFHERNKEDWSYDSLILFINSLIICCSDVTNVRYIDIIFTEFYILILFDDTIE